jgi:hypothetical protein
MSTKPCAFLLLLGLAAACISNGFVPKYFEEITVTLTNSNEFS